MKQCGSARKNCCFRFRGLRRKKNEHAQRHFFAYFRTFFLATLKPYQRTFYGQFLFFPKFGPVVGIQHYGASQSVLPIWLANLASQFGWPIWLANLAGELGWPIWLANLPGRSGWPIWLTNLAGRSGCPILLANLAGRSDWPSWQV